jgi:hypothetical protein
MIISTRLLLAVGSAGIVIPQSGCSPISPETHQAQIHHMGHHVMPFDLNRTKHVFQMAETGGILRVIAKDPKDKNKLYSSGNTFSMKWRASKTEISPIRPPFMAKTCQESENYPQIHHIS